MKTLKVEQVNAQAYRNLHEARRDIGHFIDVTYSQHRLHSPSAIAPRLSSRRCIFPSIAATPNKAINRHRIPLSQSRGAVQCK